MAGRFALIPAVRTAMAAVGRPPATGDARLRLTYQVEILGNGTAVPNRVPIGGELKGPGDIVGFNRQVIVRVEPEPGLRGFEPNYLPFVEFIDADFPWRYSLDTASGGRIRPWLSLLALRPEEFEYIAQGRAPLPRIRVASPVASLPNLSQSWAHAHVQVDLAEGGGVEATVAADASAHFSRLFCPRKLEERTQYYLFLVPAYEAGRLAGLGRREAAASYDAPAWSADAAEPVELPVYFQSRFSTNELEDIETLVGRLRGIEAGDVGAGETTTASAADPGYYEGYERRGATFEVPAALRQPGAREEPYGTDPALATKLKATLEEVISGERVGAGQDGPSREDPLVAMPPYGWRFRNDTVVSPANARRGDWFHRTNLDLRFRLAAGLGAETVRKNQELFAQKCWEQYDEVLEANLRLRRLRFAELIAARVNARFQRLPSDALVALAEPVHALVEVAGQRSIADALQANGTPTSFASRAVRRVAAKRPVTRTASSGVSQVGTPMPLIPGDLTPDRVMHRARKRSAPRGTGSGPAAGAEFQRGLSAFFAAGAFPATARARSFALPVGEFRSSDYSVAIASTLKSLPALKADFMVGGRLEREKLAIAPIYRSPLVPLPLADRLQAFAKDSLLPGVSALPENTVSAFEENRAFIEAFLVGANHAMNAELRWREFPTDMRGTIFRRFWDRGRPASDAAGDDIAAIHTWKGKLGNHFPPGTDKEADLVIVIRGDIVRKLGQFIVVLNEASSSTWTSGSGTDHEPVFFGRIGRDTVYYGFDVARSRILAARDRAFLVLYEPVGRLRFGLDVATAAVRQQRRRHENVSLPFPLKSLNRSYEQVPARLPGLHAAAPAQPSTWDDLSWSHVGRSPAGYIDFSRTISIADQPQYWGADRTSATIARSLWQKPLAAVLPLSRVL